MSHESVADLVSNDRMARALFALLELSKALGSEVDLDALLRVIVENASSVVDAERTSIFVYDPAIERLWSRVAQGLGEKTLEVDLGSGVAGDVALTRQLANIPDAYADPRFNATFDQRTGFRTKSIICAPILGSDGALLGVIQSVNKTTGESFDGRDESLMRAISSHVAVAFERARLTEVHLQNERLEQALRLANEIQMRMLPDPAASSEGGEFVLHAQLRPAKDVGGDLYDYFVDGDRLYFCIGDVSGKGAGAALIMAVTKTLFRANALLLDDPAKVLGAMSARIYEETDPAMFVTAVCGWLDLRDGSLRYANAGHERAMVLGAGGADVRYLESRPGLALGIFPSFTYTFADGRLSPGEALFFITDGVTDATNAAVEMFGAERLLLTLRSCASSPPPDVISTVLGAVDAFAAGAPQADDITMMCIRYRPDGA
jgi:sigma-B regulation protein RsbU (phosphoserine phosphatase)